MALPILDLGVGGVFAIVLIDRVLNWAIKFKNGKNGKERPRCVYSPEVKDALLNNILTRGSMDRVEKHMESLSKSSLIQTTLLKQQNETLKEIARNSKS